VFPKPWSGIDRALTIKVLGIRGQIDNGSFLLRIGSCIYQYALSREAKNCNPCRCSPMTARHRRDLGHRRGAPRCHALRSLRWNQQTIIVIIPIIGRRHVPMPKRAERCELRRTKPQRSNVCGLGGNTNPIGGVRLAARPRIAQQPLHVPSTATFPVVWMFGWLPGRTQLKAGSRLLVSPFPRNPVHPSLWVGNDELARRSIR
jgi:hypothetical protein